jgi:hypothetical protein
MSETGLTREPEPPTHRRMRIMLFLLPLVLAGCVNVSAPDKPIEINLNINVTQEVVYRLDAQAKTVIQQNPGIF